MAMSWRRWKPLYHAHIADFRGDWCSPSSISSNNLTRWLQAVLLSTNASRALMYNGYNDDHNGGRSDGVGRHNYNANPASDAESRFFGKLDKLSKGQDSFSSSSNAPSSLNDIDWLSDTFGPQSGASAKLMKAATFFEFDEDEIMADDYTFRPDLNFRQGTAYNTKDLDLSKQRPNKFSKRLGFEVTSEEVRKNADFRNVNFLANFLTEAGIIIKRSQTGISAKAQRRVAREIKTARAFGLMPFETMGSKPFVAGRSMESIDKDYEFESYNIAE